MSFMAQFILKIYPSYIWRFLFNSALKHPRKCIGTLCLESIYCAWNQFLARRTFHWQALISIFNNI